MSDIFISYSSRDRSLAEMASSALKTQGLSTWWDAELRSGTQYDSEIERELISSLNALVIWTRNSVASKWVRAEATLADRKSKLLALRSEKIDLPPPFLLTQAPLIDFSQPLNGNTDWQMLVEAARSRCAGERAASSVLRDRSGQAELRDGRVRMDRARAYDHQPSLDGFIVYHSDDRSFVRDFLVMTRGTLNGERAAENSWLRRIIARRAPPLRFIDRSVVQASLVDMFDRYVPDCRKLIVICTPNSSENKWIDHEIDVFSQLRGAENIIPVVFSGKPLSGSNSESVPRRLRFQVDAEGRVSDVPQHPFLIDLRNNEADQQQLLARAIRNDDEFGLLSYREARKSSAR